MGQRIRSHRDLDVYQMGFEAAMRIFEMTNLTPLSHANCTRPTTTSWENW